MLRIIETESLTTEQIQQLSPHSSQYIIPYNKKKSKRYGVIFFRSEGRLGAAAEADDLEQSLLVTGCDVIKMEWSKATELHNMKESALSRIVADCSLLIVCLMSHGSRGALADCHGKEYLSMTSYINSPFHYRKKSRWYEYSTVYGVTITYKHSTLVESMNTVTVQESRIAAGTITAQIQIP